MSEDPRHDPRGVRPETPRHGRFYPMPTTSGNEQNYSPNIKPTYAATSEPSPYQPPIAWAEGPRSSIMNLPPPLQPGASVAAYRRQHSLSLDSSSSRPSGPGFGDLITQPEPFNPASGNSPSYSPGSSAQKRAFRQRRKDPSCDACRERKVKCDATDTMSCSECASRQVKCQFTKETNRRMSSMKQLQDLERQLTQAKQQNDRLRSILRDSGSAMDIDSAAASLGIPGPLLEPQPAPGRFSGRSSAYDEARRNVRSHSRGIFKPPPAHRVPRQPKILANDVPALPSKQSADQLIRVCHDSFCLYSPVLHWPTFLEEYETTYRMGSLHQAPRSWIALLFVMFALGTLSQEEQAAAASERKHEGSMFLREALQQMTGWTDEPNIDHCRAALMISTYYMEINIRTASWTWHSLAVANAIEIGLNEHSPLWSAVEAETRRRVWWAIYSWDRLLSLEMARWPLIRQEDTQVPMPRVTNDLPTQAESALPTMFGQYSPSPLEVVMPIARLAEPLRRATKIRPVPLSTLREYDTTFDSIASAMPESLRPHSTTYLDPNMLRVSSSLANARLTLHRLNLAPACSADERASALARCAAAAESTARLVSRTLQPPPNNSQPFTDPGRSALTWEVRARSSASSMLCTHMWRSILFLALTLDFGSALQCVRVSTAIGDLRPVNVACGRYLIFFLERLIERMRTTQWSKQALEQDEEMLAYASGDIQQDTESAWIWDDDATPLQQETPFFSTTAGPTDTSSPTREPAESSAEVWPRVEALLLNLRHEQQRQRPLPPFRQHGRSHSTASIAGSEATASAGTPPPGSAFSPGGSERMNIANII